MTTTDIGPVAKGERIGALDVLRGVAVCGILLMNIPIMGLARQGPTFPPAANADWIAFTIQSLMFEGSMRGLFTLLFGAGMLIMLRQSEAGGDPRAVQAYFTRCFALILLGIANFALFLWPGEILFNYGVVGMALFLFRKADLRMLWTAAIALLLFSTVILATPSIERAEKLSQAAVAVQQRKDGKKLTEEQTKLIEFRTEAFAERTPKPEEIARQREERTSFPGVLAWSIKEWSFYNLGKFALPFLLESLGAMLIGLALFRTGVLTGAKSLGFYAKLAVAGYGVGMAVRGVVLTAQWNAGFYPDPVAGLLWNWTYEFSRIPLTFGALGLVMLLFKSGAIGWIAGGLTAIGRLALTNYVGQSVITAILFYGLGYFDRFGFAQLMGICVLIWIAQGIFSLIWLRIFEMGPLEWLLRNLTYGAWRRLPRRAAA
jgi:uncharacterized protein